MSGADSLRAGRDAHLAGLERELAVLVRHLDGFGRRSDLYRGLGAGRAGYLLLMTLNETGDATIGALAATLGLDGSTVTRQIAAMESEGLVERRSDPEDRRCSIIRASRRGGALLEAVRARRTERIDALLAGWPAEDRESLERLLARLNREIAAARPARAAGPGPIAA
jgi:DNA-binding MarR family transcriptional regulator